MHPGFAGAVDTLPLPAVHEPFLASAVAGGVEFQENGGNRPWIVRRLSYGCTPKFCGLRFKLAIIICFDYLVIDLMGDLTLILRAVRRGDKQTSQELLPLVYDELRRLAAARMAREAAGQTLQPTALVHEAWIRLVKDEEEDWRDRSYFFAAAAEAMRRILVENARRKSRFRHGGGQERLNIEGVELAEPTSDEKLLLVDEALAVMEEEHPELARIVTLKYFTGLTNKEVAETLGVSESTVDRQWFSARRWLFNEIQALICGGHR